MGWHLLLLAGFVANAQDDLLRTGQEAFQRGDFPRAEQAFAEYAGRNPNSAEAWSNLAAAQSRLEKFEAAIANYEKALKLDPKLTPVHFNLAVALIRSGQCDRAVQSLERFLAEHPNELRAQQLSGICLVELGDHRHGIQQLENVYAAKSREPSVIFALAAAHIRGGDAARGEELLMGMEFVAGAQAQVHLLRGLLAYRARNYTTAEEEFQEVLKTNPDSAPALAALGRLRLRVNDDKPAIELFEKALKLAPQDAESTYQLGVLLDRNGAPDRGKQLLKHAIALRAAYPDPMYWLAKIELREGNSQAALALLEEAVKHAPEQEAIHFQLARTYQALGMDAQAKREFAEVRRLKQAAAHRRSFVKPEAEEPVLKMEEPP